MINIFRNIKINSEDEFEAVLYKNFREPLCKIPNEYIKEIDYKLRDYFTLNLEVKDKVTHNGKTIDNPLYNKFKGKRFIIVNGIERYIIDDIKIESNKNINTKKIIAKSFEYDLKSRDISTLEGVYQLYKNKDDKINIEEGILNWLEKETTWKVGFIDPDAKSTTGLFPETKDVKLYEPLKLKNIENNMILYDKDINIDIGKQSLNFKIKYSNIKSTDTKSNIIKTENKEHSFEKFAQPVIHVKATYGLDESHNTVIKYEFKLKDGFIQKIEKPFTYLQNLDVKIDSIYLSYETGKEVEKTKVKYRSLEKNTQKWMSFIRETVEHAFDCLFQFDTVNKVVNVIARQNLGKDNGFYLYYNQYLMKLERDLRVSEVVTRLGVEGKDRLGISGVNPYGTNYVEDFTYLLKEDNISLELRNALLRYQELCNKIFFKWSELKKQKDEKSKNIVYIEAQLQELRAKLNAKKSIEVSYIKMGEDISDIQQLNFVEIKKEVNEMQSQVNSLMKQFSNLKNEMKSIDLKMQDLNLKLDKKKALDEKGIIFTEDDLNELDECIYSESMQDDYYTNEQELYENAKRVLSERNTIPISFTADIVGITSHPRGWKNLIKLGDKAYIVDKDDNIIENKCVNIVGFKYIPPRKNVVSKVTNIEFNNEAFALHDLKTIRNISVRKIDYNKAAISFWKNTWVDSALNNKVLNDIQKNGINTSLLPITSKSNANDTDITGSGVWCTDKSDNTTNKQMYFGSGFMAVTGDNWETCRTITDEKGLVAKSIFGTSILGDRMNMANLDNTLRIDKNGTSVYDENNNLKARIGFYDVNGETKSSIVLYDKNGKVMVSGEGIANTDSFIVQDEIDQAHPIEIPLYLHENIEVRQAKIFLFLNKYRVNFEGTEAGGRTIKTTEMESGKFTYYGGNVTTDISGENMVINKQNIEDLLNDKINAININNKHSHTQDSHIHGTSIHNHVIKLDNHKHESIYRIIETTLPTDVELFVNDRKVADKIMNDVELDITRYLKVGQVNKIKLTSQTNGRINSLISLNEFVNY